MIVVWEELYQFATSIRQLVVDSRRCQGCWKGAEMKAPQASAQTPSSQILLLASALRFMQHLVAKIDGNESRSSSR